MQKWNYSQFLTNFMLDKKSFLICEALFLATQARADRNESSRFAKSKNKMMLSTWIPSNRRDRA